MRDLLRRLQLLLCLYRRLLLLLLKLLLLLLLWLLIRDLLENANVFEIVAELQHYRIQPFRARVYAAAALQR